MNEDSMSKDLTQKSADPELDKLTLILRIVRKLETHGALLVQVIERLDKFGERFDKLTARVDALETRLNVIETRLDAIEGRLQILEQTVKRSVHNLGRGQAVLNDAILKIHISFLDIDERLQGLDARTSLANSQT
ncbi:MAG TPA: hypothetical protein VJT15_21765 [Pyrinomonadaceae bacterium]|nr:hypothetical protein [Pyrinomonadaceae bacterium]